MANLMDNDNMKILKRLLFALLMIPIVFTYIITVIIGPIIIFLLFIILHPIIGSILWIITGKYYNYGECFDCICIKHERVFLDMENYLRKKLLHEEL